MENERQVFINTMIIRCGLNPEEMVRRVENTGERIDYETGGVEIFLEGDLICARVDNYLFGRVLNYRWRKNERGN